MLKGCKNLKQIENQSKLTNVKSKRRRNLVKKAIELSNLCDVETVLVVRDKKTKRITLYESSADEFTLEDAKKLLDDIKFAQCPEALKWSKISYTNENYMNIKEEPVVHIDCVEQDIFHDSSAHCSSSEEALNRTEMTSSYLEVKPKKLTSKLLQKRDATTAKLNSVCQENNDNGLDCKVTSSILKMSKTDENQ